MSSFQYGDDAGVFSFLNLLVHNLCFNNFLKATDGYFMEFSFKSSKTHPPVQPALPCQSGEVKYGKHDQVLPLLLCDKILLSPWPELGKHQRDFSMTEVALTLHSALGEDRGWIFRCNLWTKIRNQPQFWGTEVPPLNTTACVLRPVCRYNSNWWGVRNTLEGSPCSLWISDP